MNSPLESKYLLILACSSRKRAEPELLPAIERYTGVNYAVLNKARREGRCPSKLDILILSAKHGLLQPDTEIQNYDQKMTPDQAGLLRGEASSRLDAHLARNNYEQIFINLGQTYLLALADSIYLPRLDKSTLYAQGAIGQRMRQMKDWLSSVSAHSMEIGS